MVCSGCFRACGVCRSSAELAALGSASYALLLWPDPPWYLGACVPQTVDGLPFECVPVAVYDHVVSFLTVRPALILPDAHPGLRHATCSPLWLSQAYLQSSVSRAVFPLALTSS